MSAQLSPSSFFLVTVDGRQILVNPDNTDCRATQLVPRYDLLKDPKEPLAVDIEFQEYKSVDAESWSHRIGRIAIVDTSKDTIYDTYVHYDYDETIEVKMPPPEFGVTWDDIDPKNLAQPISEVSDALNRIMADRTIIGHGMGLDIASLKPALHCKVDFVDTQAMYGKRKLSTCAQEELKTTIQEDELHFPTEDALATMELYLLVHPYEGWKDIDPAALASKKGLPQA